MGKTSIEIDGLRLSGGSGEVVVEVLQRGTWTQILKADPVWDYDYETGEKISFSLHAEVDAEAIRCVIRQPRPRRRR
jgi:hypothetical protein